MGLLQKIPKIKFQFNKGEEQTKEKMPEEKLFCQNCKIKVTIKGWKGLLSFLNKTKLGFEYENGYYCEDCNLKLLRQNRNKAIEMKQNGNN